MLFSQEIIHMLWDDSNCSHIAKYWKSLSGGLLMCVSSANCLVLSKAASKQALFSSPCFPDEPRQVVCGSAQVGYSFTGGVESLSQVVWC